jgi:hypothetical protein
MLSEMVAADGIKQYSFLGDADLPEGEGRSADRNFRRQRSAASFQASRDPLYLTAHNERHQRTGVIPLDVPPRKCPCCQAMTIIYQPRAAIPCRARRPARMYLGAPGPMPSVPEELQHITGLAGSVRPYSLRCRQQACERIAAGVTTEQAAPGCHDATRSPDPATVRL